MLNSLKNKRNVKSGANEMNQIDIYELHIKKDREHTVLHCGMYGGMKCYISLLWLFKLFGNILIYTVTNNKNKSFYFYDKTHPILYLLSLIVNTNCTKHSMLP